MKAFQYHGKTTGGRTVKGTLEAANEVEARVKLRAQRIIPIKVIEKGSKADTGPGMNLMARFGFHDKVKGKDLQVFTRQFSTMINSGIPIVQAIDMLGTQSSSPVLRRILMTVKERVEGGRRLGESIDGWPGVFSRLYVSLVKAGEEGGVLDTILNRLAAYLEKNGKLKNKVTGALWYPFGIMIVAGIVIALLLTFVIPKFEQLFKSAGQELPALTQMVINASHFLQEHYLIIFGFFGGVIFAAQRYYESKGGRETCDGIFIRLPVFGDLIQKSSIARFTRTMSTMLSCGVGILEALEICGNVVGNAVVEKAIMRARVAIADGKSITQPLSQEKFIPPMVVQMIGVGEATGTLDTMLGKIADFYEEEVDYAVGALTSMMEPMMMVFLGGIIAVLVVAMYLPIFNLAGTMK